MGQEVTLISNTPHASKVYTTSIATFENTPNRQKTAMPIGLQILSKVELVEATCVKPIKEIINQSVIEG
jgi:hypothetical protein